ncbi:MAG: EscU/YscU/HrcU family type III secretion system export apparatus switch protein [Myxococcales bacterium]|nr:EscU/YscU/HrcU family type III secretion system export apparatus switch protein [Myxococcales bacterium]MDD9965685.1 EscU/YscU/HrcU family type III secretion system export apparatus switch protein [Myxococcales bacterium]
MADKDEQTEDASAKKLARLHEDGSVAKSSDINTVAVLVGVTLTMLYVGPAIASEVMAISVRMFRLEDQGEVLRALGRVMPVLRVLGIPVFVASFCAFSAGVAQARVFTVKPLIPKPDRLNPFPNFKKILPNKETFIEFAKQVLKLGAVGGTVIVVVVDTAPRFSILPIAELAVAALTVAEGLGELALKAVVAFTVVAIVDYLLARRKFLEDAKMSKQEVKDEKKQEDISPEVRAEIRKRMLQANGFIPGAVEDATVLVTNPTHYAIALRYEVDTDAAPLVLSKGADKVAQKMRAEARQHEVPIVENRPLARALFAEARVGEPIPVDFYRAVAEVIAFVMQLRARRYGVAPSGGQA